MGSRICRQNYKNYTTLKNIVENTKKSKWNHIKTRDDSIVKTILRLIYKYKYRNNSIIITCII